MKDNINVEVIKAGKTSLFCNYIFKAIPLAFDESMSYYECLCGLLNYLKNTIIPTVNNNADAVAELQDLFTKLQNFVNNYFDNLDVQDEINNKLDQMVEDGTLQEIIASYLNNKAIFGYDTVASMKQATNLINGSYAQTLGYYNKNDGGGALYKIRTKNDNDIIDDAFLIELNSGLIAELITINDTINILQAGLINDGTTDNTSKMQNIINRINENSTIFIPSGTFYFASALNLKNKITFKGEEVIAYNQIPTSCLKFNGNGFQGNTFVTYKNLNLVGNNQSGTVCIPQSKPIVENCHISQFASAIYTPQSGIINKCHLYRNTIGINGAIDSRISDNFIYGNKGNGISLYKGSNDNIIINNKIEWNESNGIQCYQAYHNIISNNIIDRNSLYGLTINDSSRCNINNNLFKRNYVNSSTSDIYSHIKVENCTNCNISDNMTVAFNSNDDGSGFVIPSTAIYITSSQNINLISNDFTGATNKQIVQYANKGNIFILDYNNQILNKLQNILPSLNLNVNSSVNVNIPLKSTPDRYGLPVAQRLLFRLRTTTQATSIVKEIYASVFYQYNNNYVVSFSDNLSDNITMSGTFNPDTNTLVITLTSTQGNYTVNVTILDI